jgi:hypothetical protein
MAKRAKNKCTVRDGLFVEPCDALQAACDGPGSRSKGVRLIALSSLTSGKQTRSFVVLHSGEYAKKGIALNWCPLCGTPIDAPFTEDAVSRVQAAA